MNALFKKIGLKQKFFIIFCIVTLFSIYQIVSDTIITSQKQQNEYEEQSKHLIFIKHLNAYVYKLQQNIIELKFNQKPEQLQKLYVLKKTEQLRKELLDIIHQSAYKDEYKLILREFQDIINNIPTLNHQSIMIKYDLLYEKLFFKSNYLAGFTHDYIDFNVLKLIHNNMAFTVYSLSKKHYLNNPKNLQAAFFNELKYNHSALHHYLDDVKLMEQLKQLQFQLLNYSNKAHSNQEYISVVKKLIQTYLKANMQLYDYLHTNLEKEQNTLNSFFNFKLFIEIMALIVTLVMLSYFYKSLFIYIRKIQNAHKIKSIFLSNMSHELRTPLNAIIGFLNILKESNDEKERKKFIDIIYKSSKQLLYIINDILDFSKIEDAKLKIENKAFNIKEEVELLVELFSANASSKNITLQKEFSDDIPECIISDKFRLKQIISNLISNAIKFTQEGGVIKVILKKKDKKLYICVEDNGIGISKKAQKSIFKSFLQANNSTARKFGGTGLGLSISSKLVNLLGSKLKVESKEMYGSRFYFNLPIKECKKREKEIKQQDTSSSYKGTVLLVEDNPTNQFLMQITLTNLKLDVILANDGIEGVERFKNNKVDLVFMDDNMPNKNGVEAAMDIIEYEKKNHLDHTPIIALTANTGAEVKKKLLNAGMDEYMSKPFDIKLLHQILQKYLT